MKKLSKQVHTNYYLNMKRKFIFRKEGHIKIGLKNGIILCKVDSFSQERELTEFSCEHGNEYRALLQETLLRVKSQLQDFRLFNSTSE
jgi:hypothetical protein